jgi:hypothetical protein
MVRFFLHAFLLTTPRAIAQECPRRQGTLIKCTVVSWSELASRERSCLSHQRRRVPRAAAQTLLRVSPRWPLSHLPAPPQKNTDLPVPATLGLLFHGGWSLYMITLFAKLGLPDDCPANAVAASTSAALLLASFLATTLLQAWLLAESLQGAHVCARVCVWGV